MKDRDRNQVGKHRQQEKGMLQEPRWRAFLEWFFSLFLGLTTALFGLLPILPELSPIWAAGSIALASIALSWKWSGRND